LLERNLVAFFVSHQAEDNSLKRNTKWAEAQINPLCQHPHLHRFSFLFSDSEATGCFRSNV